jgi:hypothetical protein
LSRFVIQFLLEYLHNVFVWKRRNLILELLKLGNVLSRKDVQPRTEKLSKLDERRP